MKKFFLLILCLGVMSLYTQYAHAQGRKLPVFSFEDLAAKPFTPANLKAGIPTIVFFYDPYCDHCAQQAEWMKGAQAKIKNVNLVWVTTERDIKAIQDFQKLHFGGTTLDKVYFLIDKKFKFDSYFGYTEAPGIYVYNKEGFLAKSFTKETPAAEVLKPIGL